MATSSPSFRRWREVELSYLTDEPVDVTALISRALRRSDGAICLFAGVVRDHHEGRRVESIDYDSYRPMAEKEIDKIVRDVTGRNLGVAIEVVHRLGHLAVGDLSIVVVCVSPHRAESFVACREIIDRIKLTVPIWKKEKGPGGEEWVGWQGEVGDEGQ